MLQTSSCCRTNHLCVGLTESVCMEMMGLKMSMILGLCTLLSFAAVGQTGRFTLGKNLFCFFCIYGEKCIRAPVDRGLCFLSSPRMRSLIRRRLCSYTTTTIRKLRFNSPWRLRSECVGDLAYLPGHFPCAWYSCAAWS